MNPEQRKNHRGGARVQKPESPRREKETKREKKPGRPRTKKQKILLGLYIALTVVAAIIVAGAIVFGLMSAPPEVALPTPVSYTHLRAHETRSNLVCRLLLEKNFF